MTLSHPEQLSQHELEERFELFASGVREYAIFLVDPQGLVICWNPGALSLFGYSALEAVGQHFSRFFSEQDNRSGLPDAELAKAQAAGRADSACWQLRKDGSRFWCAATMTPLFDEIKQIRSFARVMHDLTDTQALVGQRKRADDLAEANRSKENFLSLLSHELRNPLAPILNALSIQRELKTADPILQQAGKVIERQIGQMVRLVDDLLDIGRITQGKLRLKKEPVEMRVIVNNAVEAARPFCNARKHDLSVLLPTEPIWVHGDAVRLEQIFANLLNNAAKYTNLGGLIRVTVQQEGGEVNVSVSDNGEGISPQMLPLVFELFTQAEGTIGHAQGGLGIGLALVATLVEMHDGRVHAFSAGLGKGSQFTLRFPTIQTTPPAETAPPSGSLAPDVKRLRVLIVEDDVDAGDMLSMLLRIKGYEVLVARTGQSALGMASKYDPSLVLCDIGLPDIDGYQVAKHLRQIPECQHAILCALSGYTPCDADDDRPLQSDFDHHFVKPVPTEKILALLQSMRTK